MNRRQPLPDAPGASAFDEFAQAIDVTRLDEAQFVRLIETVHMLGTAGTGIDLASLSTGTFVSIIERASAEQLDALMAHDELRQVVLDEVFTRMTRHVRPDAPDAVVHWRFTGGHDQDGLSRYQTVISGGRCTSGGVQDLDPRATVTITPSDFLKVVTGTVSAPLLFLRGRVKVKGDIPFVAGMIKHFDLQSARP